MLGFGRLQRCWLRRNWEPAPEMHGRPCASAGTCEYDQLPLVEDAEIRDQPEEAEIKKKEGDNTKKLGKWRDSTQVQVHVERRGNGPVRFLPSMIRMCAQIGFIQRARDGIHMVEGREGGGREIIKQILIWVCWWKCIRNYAQGHERFFLTNHQK